MILPSIRAINEIYGQMVQGRFQGESAYFLAIANNLPNTSVKLWTWMRQKMLPSPSKFHYTFNLRDISRIFQGVLRTPRKSIPNVKTLMLLWRHECERVFADKLTTNEDKLLFNTELNRCTEDLLTSVNSTVVNSTVPVYKNSLEKFSAKTTKKSMIANSDSLMINTNNIITIDDLTVEETHFVDFLRDDEYDDDGILIQEAPKIYELGGTMDYLRNRVKFFLEKYNEVNLSRQMNIVLFDDAMKHLIRISRILGMPKGCMLLVGVGGNLIFIMINVILY